MGSDDDKYQQYSCDSQYWRDSGFNIYKIDGGNMLLAVTRLAAFVVMFSLNYYNRVQLSKKTNINVVKGLILPSYWPYIYVFCGMNLLFAIIDLLLEEAKDPGTIDSWLLPLEVGAMHWLREGLALFLTRYGAGIKAIKRSLMYSYGWGVFTALWYFFLLSFLIDRYSFTQSNTDAGRAGLFAMYIIYMGALFFSYGTFAFVSPRVLYHRPAMKFYSRFNALYSLMLICIGAAMYGEAFDVVCPGSILIYIFSAFVEPAAIYITLQIDSAYWQGLRPDVGNPVADAWDHLELDTATSMADNLSIFEQGSAKLPLLHFGFVKIDKKDFVAGGFSRVYFGTLKKEPVAFKIVYAMELTPFDVQEFYKEATVLYSLQHENVVGCKGICIMPPALNLVLELCKYGSLFDFLHKPQPHLGPSTDKNENPRGSVRHSMMQKVQAVTDALTFSSRSSFAARPSRMKYPARAASDRNTISSYPPPGGRKSGAAAVTGGGGSGSGIAMDRYANTGRHSNSGSAGSWSSRSSLSVLSAALNPMTSGSNAPASSEPLQVEFGDQLGTSGGAVETKSSSAVENKVGSSGAATRAAPLQSPSAGKPSPGVQTSKAASTYDSVDTKAASVASVDEKLDATSTRASDTTLSPTELMALRSRPCAIILEGDSDDDRDSSISLQRTDKVAALSHSSSDNTEETTAATAEMQANLGAEDGANTFSRKSMNRVSFKEPFQSKTTDSESGLRASYADSSRPRSSRSLASEATQQSQPSENSRASSAFNLSSSMYATPYRDSMFSNFDIEDDDSTMRGSTAPGRMSLLERTSRVFDSVKQSLRLGSGGSGGGRRPPVPGAAGGAEEDGAPVTPKSYAYYLSLVQRMQMVRDCACAIAFLHSKGYMHCDIKSLNFLVTEDYRVKLADMGEAKLVNSPPKRDRPPIPARNWAPPEVLPRDASPDIYTLKSDVYGLSMVLAEIIMLELPLGELPNRVSLEKFWSMLVEENIRPVLPKDEAVLPYTLRGAIEQGWQTDPSKRLSAEDLCAACEDCLRGLQTRLSENTQTSD